MNHHSKNTIKNNLKIYNSLTKKKDIFYPIYPNHVGMYVCGPTVYNHIHLGNCRTFIFFDIVYRYLKHLGYQVKYVRNITDIGHLFSENNELEEDKIIKRSRIEGLDPMEIVQKYTIYFHESLNILNVLRPNIEPIATGHITEQIEYVKKILCNKFAYEKNGSIYFDLKNYSNHFLYGRLSNNNIKELMDRNFLFSKEKRDIKDFCLWKKAKKNHIMNWNSPWGKGFPGWHIECSVMSTKYLGGYFDIHGGGIDLKFPHHECELAQSTSFFNKKNDLSRYWMHVNMLNINGEKMSKSKKNFMYPSHIYENFKISSNILRFFMLQTHYRSILIFSNKNLLDAKKNYNFIINSINKLNNVKFHKDIISYDFIHQWIDDCYNAINDDFNTPLLISYLLKGSRIINDIIINNKKNSLYLLKKYINYFMFEILGFKKNKEETNNYKKKLEILVQRLINLRKEYRIQKNWEVSDKIRKELNHIGILINDHKLLK
ncbi:cysteine--tRNA ligase [Blattabacterium cuenoti]|uniref:cysteine--tRNA ligase n=1 Tax=Blattabacterium cuenoti TaxID=1653831 RepID=UPI00163CA088|nr:cysteine--tRNA ligase [Blattabacterium cuenoti]